jgi:hypothetical protein
LTSLNNSFATLRLCEKNQTLNPPRRTGRIRRLSQKDLLNLREKKNFFASLRPSEKKKRISTAAGKQKEIRLFSFYAKG